MPSAVDYQRSGAYAEFPQTRSSTLPASTGAIVAIPVVDDWGPVGVPTLVPDFATYLSVFGKPVDPTAPSAGYVAVYNAFKGEKSDRPGAGQVLVYRMAGSAKAKATKTLAAGGNSIVLTAKYEGVYGNNISAAVVVNGADPTNKRDILLYEGSLQVEAYRGYAAADLVAAQTAINAASQYVVASGATNGTILTAAAKASFTGGNSGNTLLAGDWTAMMTAMESQRFGYLAPYDLTDTTIQASMFAWAAALNAKKKAKKFFTVVGGLAGEVYSAAATRAIAANNENIVSLGVGTYKDTAITAAGLQMSTSQLAPRLAGILSQRGGRSSISFANLEDLLIVVGPTDDDMLNSGNEGTVTLGLGEVGVQVQSNVSTFQKSSGTVDKPWATYSKIKYVTTMQGIYRRARERNENGDVLGALPVNNDTREKLVGDLLKDLGELVPTEIRASPAPIARISQDPPPSDDQDFIVLEYVAAFSRSLEKTVERIYLT